MKNNAYLFGPFFGELSWEYFQFAPYAIYVKKNDAKSNLVVYTRPDRFDLYGQYADILVPLRIKNENYYKQTSFKLQGYDDLICEGLNHMFASKYKKFFRNSVHHCVPDISSLRYNLKWQFPREKMDYDFRPRLLNRQYINKIFNTKDVIVVDKEYNYDNRNYNIIHISDFNIEVQKVNNKNLTYLGCLIELIKIAKFTISDLKSDVGRLSILLKTPLIYPNREITLENVKLLNPLNTTIIDCDKIQEGVRIYEDNF